MQRFKKIPYSKNKKFFRVENLENLASKLYKIMRDIHESSRNTVTRRM